MKLWEASHRGNLLTEARHARYFSVKKDGTCQACALGAIVVGALGIENVQRNYEELTMPIYSQLYSTFPQIRGMDVMYPGHTFFGRWMPLTQVIEALFEKDLWERERIEGWLQEMDV